MHLRYHSRMDPMRIATILLAVVVALLVVWFVLLERRIGRLTRGSDAHSLEDTINKNQTDLEDFFSFKKEMLGEIATLDRRMRKKIHGVKTLRFNPFHGTGSGGNQSFATALLDEDGSGVVISSLYSREKLSIFAKPIKNRKSEFELTEEEAEVLK